MKTKQAGSSADCKIEAPAIVIWYGGFMVQAGGLDKFLHMLGIDAQVQGDMHADSSLVV